MDRFEGMTIDQIAAHIRELRVKYAGAKADGHLGSMRGLEEAHLAAMTEYRRRILEKGERVTRSEDDIL